MKKERECSLVDNEKEPVIERIFTLVERYPSRNEAAKAWGININTLQNYYKRRDLAPTPRRGLLEVIAQHEGVTLEWLLNGEGTPPKNAMKERGENSPILLEYHSDTKLASLFEILTEEEKQSLFEVLVRKGVETVLRLSDDRNIRLLQCNDYDKDRFLSWLDGGIKKGTFETREDVTEPDPSSSNKKVG
nr:hypothetical protein [uncultured Rahnella sp.]